VCLAITLATIVIFGDTVTHVTYSFFSSPPLPLNVVCSPPTLLICQGGAWTGCCSLNNCLFCSLFGLRGHYNNATHGKTWRGMGEGERGKKWYRIWAANRCVMSISHSPHAVHLPCFEPSCWILCHLGDCLVVVYPYAISTSCFYSLASSSPLPPLCPCLDGTRIWVPRCT
jgi:hypothetical protein